MAKAPMSPLSLWSRRQSRQRKWLALDRKCFLCAGLRSAASPSVSCISLLGAGDARNGSPSSSSFCLTDRALHLPSPSGQLYWQVFSLLLLFLCPFHLLRGSSQQCDRDGQIWFHHWQGSTWNWTWSGLARFLSTNCAAWEHCELVLSCFHTLWWTCSSLPRTHSQTGSCSLRAWKH